MTVTRSIFRYEVPVDDLWHAHDLSGAVLHVDCRDEQVVEFWALHSGGPTVRRWFRVYGTGQQLPEGRLQHRGTVIAPGGRLVWHLVEGPPAST